MSDDFTIPPDGTISRHDDAPGFDADVHRSGVNTLSIEQRMLLAGIEPIVDDDYRQPAARPALDDWRTYLDPKPRFEVQRPNVYVAVINGLCSVEDIATMNVADYLQLANVITDEIMEGLR